MCTVICSPGLVEPLLSPRYWPDLRSQPESSSSTPTETLPNTTASPPYAKARFRRTLQTLPFLAVHSSELDQGDAHIGELSVAFTETANTLQQNRVVITPESSTGNAHNRCSIASRNSLRVDEPRTDEFSQG
jgi:hypothetical protein